MNGKKNDVTKFYLKKIVDKIRITWIKHSIYIYFQTLKYILML